MARQRRAVPGNVGGVIAGARFLPRLLALAVAMGATSVLFVIAHFTTAACGLCRVQQFLMAVLLLVLALDVTDKRPIRFLRQATWLAGAGLLVAVPHFILSVGSVSDPCAGIAVCAHPDTNGASRASPATAALFAFAGILAFVRYATSMSRRPSGRRLF